MTKLVNNVVKLVHWQMLSQVDKPKNSVQKETPKDMIKRVKHS